VERQRV